MTERITETASLASTGPKIVEFKPGFGYGVVALCKTNLEEEAYIALTRMFGDLNDVKPYNKVSQKNRLRHNELFRVGHIEANGSIVNPSSSRAQASRGNSLFHIDSSFKPRRAGYSLLLSHDFPSPGTGRGTEF
ncbi:hypothetical protein ACJZ2D_004264 [Fusarium nematophilum]